MNRQDSGACVTNAAPRPARSGGPPAKLEKKEP